MEMFLLYLLQTQLCLALLWLFYRFGLTQNSAFGQQRAFLLLSVVVSFVIPMLSIPVYAPDVVAMNYTVRAPENSYIDTVTGISLDIYTLLLIVSLCVSGALLLLLARDLRKIRHLMHQAQVVDQDGVKLLYTEQSTQSFSFFHCIVVGCQEQSSAIIAHEMAHVRLHHSLDCLLIELMRILFWWNPMVWMWGKSLKEIHEYQADEAVLNCGFDTKYYIHLLLQELTYSHPEIVSGFSYSRLKKRLKMIAKPNQGRYAKFRILLALPMFALLLILFSFTEKPTIYVVESSEQGTQIRKAEAADPLAKQTSTIAVGENRPKTNDAQSAFYKDITETSVPNKEQSNVTVSMHKQDSLYIIDGVPYEGKEAKAAMRKLIPEDIESVSIYIPTTNTGRR